MEKSCVAFCGVAVATVSVQFAVAAAKQLFPARGVGRISFLRFALGAVLLAPVFKPWRTRVKAREWPLLLLYSAVLGAMNL